MISLRASTRGLEIVNLARKKKGWTKTRTSSWWLEATTSQATLKRFWRRIPISEDNFVSICQVVGIVNWQEIAETESPNHYLIEAPDVSIFYGRTQEKDQLLQWITSGHCRLLALLGMGGIGKSSLAAKLVDTIGDEFEYVIWRSLLYNPLLSDIITDLLPFFSANDEVSNNVNNASSTLLHYLQKYRCLLVLDDFDSVLKSGNLAGCYCEGYEAWGEFIKRIAQERHQSCLLLISTEKPKEIPFLEEKTTFVHSLKLKGLDSKNAKRILKDKGLSAEGDDWEEIIEMYKGNPLSLKLVATTIQELFGGNVSEFLREGTYIFGNILILLEQQFNRLSDLEKQIMYWLARNQEWDSLTELRSQLVPEVSKQELVDALNSLQRRFLIERSRDIAPFALQPLVKRYLIKHT
jgi:NB-ARC domain